MLLTCLHELLKIILHHLVNMIRVGVRVPYVGSHRCHGVMQDLCCSSPLLEYLVNMIRVGVRVPYVGSHRYHGVMQDLCCSSPLLGEHD